MPLSTIKHAIENLVFYTINEKGNIHEYECQNFIC